MQVVPSTVIMVAACSDLTILTIWVTHTTYKVQLNSSRVQCLVWLLVLVCRAEAIVLDGESR